MSLYPKTVHPTTEANWPNENVRTNGITLREHYAGLAMQALVSSGNHQSWDYLTDDAVGIADQLISKLGDE